MNINSNFFNIRKKLGFNQTDFAEKLETSQNLISKYEKGQVELPFKIINNLHKVFNININWLLTGSGEMFENENNKPSEKKDIDITSKISEELTKLTDLQKEYYYHKIKSDALENEIKGV
ncbi:helix-turn-helix domain-containing protein [Malaciobacter marinus]|jgi:transcriptional regulator with XRE-family HTH domain|uniref:helix-turn-helix domain-containing protein n=1 Tax=Malaciobacter marinus TaxID=505249 RepID=UPI0009CA197D|nr:helix-turn-helix transcriptional regulator [Malaciobacter marinus]SKB73053.1 Helix-turn-helix domain-containing protein [Malaciobacter marinus]